MRQGQVKGGVGAGSLKPHLPEPFAGWFSSRLWQPRAHQLALLDRVRGGRDTLLIAPTGGGKTLAGFLPSLIDLAGRRAGAPPAQSVHTLYVSPLKALATDIARNLATPVAEMALSDPTRDAYRGYAAIPPGAPACPPARYPSDDA